MFTIIGADQKHYGPVSADDIRLWIKEGRADGRTLAQAEGATEWQPLSAFPEFAAFTAATGVPPRLSSTPPSPANPASELLAAPRNFDVAECLGHGWTLWTNNVGLLAGATFVIWALDLALQAIPFAGAIMGGILYGGLYLLYLNRIRGREAAVTEIFAGFGSASMQLMLVGIVTSLLTMLAYFACILPWVYFKIVWVFAVPLVIDKRLEFWSAMETSRRAVSRVWFKLFVLTFVAFAPYILFQGFVDLKIMSLMYTQTSPLMSAGFPDFAKMMQIMLDVSRSHQTIQLQLAAQVLLLLNLPFGIASQMQAYETLFGTRPAPSA